MSKQQSVQQQNAATRAQIELVAERFANDPQGFSWLHTVLARNGLDPRTGLLVILSELADQEGNVMSGLWLTQTRQFWEFSVVIARTTGELLSVDQFSNVTESMVVNASVRGIGHSFGHLACQVLSEWSGR